jgi:hypothetical protein
MTDEGRNASDDVLRYRQEYADSVTAASASFDKAAATLAAGGLALSIAFVRDIAPQPVHKGWIGLAWVAFAVALLFSMASFLTSEYAHRHLIKELDEGKPLADLTLGLWGWSTQVLNIATAVLVVAGVGFVAYFAYLNL